MTEQRVQSGALYVYLERGLWKCKCDKMSRTRNAWGSKEKNLGERSECAKRGQICTFLWNKADELIRQEKYSLPILITTAFFPLILKKKQNHNNTTIFILKIQGANSL